MMSAYLRPPELFVLKIAVGTLLLDVVLIAGNGVAVDVFGYAAIVCLACLLMMAGLAYRHSERSEAIGATAICGGLFILFTSALSLYNYLLLPNGLPTIDHWLVKIDSYLGYSWPGALAWSSRHLVANEIMRFAYLSTLPQIALLVVVLGLTGRLRDLHSLMVTTSISALITVIFWAVFPSLGPSALYSPPLEVLAVVRPVVDPTYGAEIASLMRGGATLVTPGEIRGLVAFPSYHIVLALIATYYARNVRWLFPVFVAVNIAVFPAVLVHGGHHLVDIPAGVLVFLAALFSTNMIIVTERPYSIVRYQ